MIIIFCYFYFYVLIQDVLSIPVWTLQEGWWALRKREVCYPRYIP